MVSAPEGQPRKEWLFDLTAEGEWQDLLAEQPDVAVRLRQALKDITLNNSRRAGRG